MARYFVLAVAVCTVAGAARIGMAQPCDVSWDSGGTSNDWSDLDNWTGDVAPDETDDVCHKTGSDVIIVDVGDPDQPAEIGAFSCDGGSNRGLALGDSVERGLKVLTDSSSEP